LRSGRGRGKHCSKDSRKPCPVTIFAGAVPSSDGSTNPSRQSKVDDGDDLAGVEGAATLT